MFRLSILSPSGVRRVLTASPLLLCLMLTGGPAAAVEGTPAVVRIEEDWELVVTMPDSDSCAPQVTCAISPTGDADSLYATFELNHQSQPAFTPGGLQLQVWADGTPLEPRKFPRGELLRSADEVVRWTQTMTLDNGQITFEIVGGSSQTWGTFGGQGYLRASLPTGLTTLAGYSPEVSVRNSGVGYAGNRVSSLVLRRVRLVTSAGQILTDSTPRAIQNN